MQPLIWRPPSARCLALSPTATRVAVLDDADELTIFATAHGQALARFQAPPNTRAIALSDEGEALAVVDAQLCIHVLGPISGATLGVPCGSRRSYDVQGGPTQTQLDVAAHDLVLTPDGRAALVANHELEDFELYYGGGTVDTYVSARLVQWPSGPSELLLSERASRSVTYRATDTRADAAPVVAAASSPGGRWVALLRRGGALLLRARAAHGSALAWGPRERSIDAFAFMPGDTELVVVDGARVSRWQLDGEREIASFELASDPRAIAASRERLACIDQQGDASLYTADGRPHGRLPRVHDSPARVARWLGEQLVLVCDDGSLVIWPRV